MSFLKRAHLFQCYPLMDRESISQFYSYKILMNKDKLNKIEKQLLGENGHCVTGKAALYFKKDHPISSFVSKSLFLYEPPHLLT